LQQNIEIPPVTTFCDLFKN